MKKILVLFSIAYFFSLTCCKKPENRVQIVMIDGIKHIQNPVVPLKGTIILELEKQLEINPYKYEGIGLRALVSAKDKDGEIILYDRNEAHKFTKEGNYLGSLFNWGQGPGEINPRDLMNIDYIDDQIWAKSPRKIIKFDKRGEFIEEIHVKNLPEIFRIN